MKPKLIKMLLLFCTIIMLFILINQIINTYALFYNESKSTLTATKANWIIKINNENISNVINREFLITQNNVIGNVNTRENHFGPNTTFETSFIIDPDNTNVAIRYEITLDSSYFERYPNIRLLSVEERSLNTTLIRTGQFAYTGIITLEEIDRNSINQIALEFEWVNDETNNETDTELGTNAVSFSVPVTVKVDQYLGEEIIPYVE